MTLAVGTVAAKLRVLLGFSRALQATLSVAQPSFVALAALHSFPSLSRTVFALSVAYAGYLSVFALNDLSDERLDRRRFQNLRRHSGFDVDAALMRHPLAQGYLTYPQGLLWISALGLYALVGAYALSPWAALLFVGAAALECIYCRLATVTAWKFLPSGAMVAIGALAGWFAVTEEIDLPVMITLLAWMFCWEIGGRNIVNDWADVEEDVHLGIRTVPVVFGQKAAVWLIAAFLFGVLVSSILLAFVAQLGELYLFVAVLAGYFSLLRPGFRLIRHPEPARALSLFNRASLYPVFMLVGLAISSVLSQ